MSQIVIVSFNGYLNNITAEVVTLIYLTTFVEDPKGVSVSNH